MALTTVAQNDLNAIRASFNENEKNSTEEKIFTHTDKEFYLAGEIVWFKLYVINTANSKPISLSKLAYAEILSADQKPVLQSKVELKDGKGNGSFQLPVAINSGVYRLRVYTRWMKNFGPDSYFEKPITIINTLKNLTVTPVPPRSCDAEFFPEGGNLVQGIQSTVGFRISDQNGNGIDGKGFLIRNNKDTIATFQPFKFGMGRFVFTPEAGNSYKAIIKLPDTVITKDLPSQLASGYVVKVSDAGETELKLNISTNITSADFVYVLVHTGQRITLLEKIFLKNNVAELRIPKSKLAEGISHIRVLDRIQLSACERSIFIQPQKKLVLNARLDKEKYSSRERVKIIIDAVDEAGKQVVTDMSVAVYRTDRLEQAQNWMIGNYLSLTSELAGKIESPGYYFSGSSPDVIEATDNLMLTAGAYRQGSAGNSLSRLVPEYNGHIVYSRVTDKSTGSPARGVVVFLSIPGVRVQFYSSISDSTGVARFYTKDLYGPNEVVLQTETNNAKYNLELISPFSDQFLESSLQPFSLSENMKGLLADYSTGMQIMNNYHGQKLKQFYTPAIDSNAFFGTPDKRYKLDDFTRFSTMEEVLREYVYEVLVRRQKDDFRLIMSDNDNRQFFDDPFTFFNGVPVFDANKIIKYDPLKVKEIDVVKSKYFFGPMIMNGIVNFITYEPDPLMLSDLNAVILEYEGMQYQREFYSPTYENDAAISGRIPDFRGLLYWSPAIATDGRGKAALDFFTSDMKGRYIVVLQGMTADGRVGTGSVAFDVE